MLFLPLELFYKTMGLLDEVNYNNNNSYNNNYKKKDNINNIACIHIITVSEMLFLLSSSCSALLCLYLKRNLILSTSSLS